ncbi:MAG: 5'/3'-nucleotidase SurE [Christensenellales bacterium]
MKILLTNDDGIHAEGIRVLSQALADHELYLFAPEGERSAISHGITLGTPLRAEKHSFENVKEAYSVGGTPADCVKLGQHIVGGFDAVFSGINHGSNLGCDVLYSGTVAAACEGMLLGIPSVAVSIDCGQPKAFPPALLECIRKSARYIEKNSLPDMTILNINTPNLPDGGVKGIKVAPIGRQRFSNEYVKRQDPRGKDYFWAPPPRYCWDEGETDYYWFEKGYITVSPITYNFNDMKLKDELEIQF